MKRFRDHETFYFILNVQYAGYSHCLKKKSYSQDAHEHTTYQYIHILYTFLHEFWHQCGLKVIIESEEVKTRILKLSIFAFSRQKAIINFRSGNPVRNLNKLLHWKNNCRKYSYCLLSVTMAHLEICFLLKPEEKTKQRIVCDQRKDINM